MKLILAVLGGSVLLAGCATGVEEKDHAAHHPAGTAAAASAPSKPGERDAMMKSMQEMHDKMMAAKTSEERSKLMQEHMKLMQEGMAMMDQMRGANGGMGMHGMRERRAMDPRMMDKRIEMMEMMMQMMVDRETMKPPAAK